MAEAAVPMPRRCFPQRVFTERSQEIPPRHRLTGPVAGAAGAGGVADGAGAVRGCRRVRGVMVERVTRPGRGRGGPDANAVACGAPPRSGFDPGPVAALGVRPRYREVAVVGSVMTRFIDLDTGRARGRGPSRRRVDPGSVPSTCTTTTGASSGRFLGSLCSAGTAGGRGAARTRGERRLTHRFLGMSSTRRAVSGATVDHGNDRLRCFHDTAHIGASLCVQESAPSARMALVAVTEVIRLTDGDERPEHL